VHRLTGVFSALFKPLAASDASRYLAPHAAIVFVDRAIDYQLRHVDEAISNEE